MFNLFCQRQFTEENRGNRFRQAAASKIARVSTENTTAGLISEVVYREDQPMMTQLLLLPLLQQLGQQSRWQLWLT
ncbi:SulA-like leucine-rich domain-containing protein, partial [Escherichia sp. R-CC3]